MAAPLPVSLGGLGLGTEASTANDTADVLRLLGRGNLSVGRLYEAHLNALRLILRYGSDTHIRAMAADVQSGHLFGLWVTDPPQHPLRMDADGIVNGSKAPCSAAALPPGRWAR